jgi:hypothetical protein
VVFTKIPTLSLILEVGGSAPRLVREQLKRLMDHPQITALSVLTKVALPGSKGSAYKHLEAEAEVQVRLRKLTYIEKNQKKSVTQSYVYY